jgi:hypothetical protein
VLRLDATTRKLQVVLGGAVTTNELPVVVSYSDKTTLNYTGATQVANTSGATAVDICSAPAASTIRDIDYVSVRNGDTASATVTIRFNDNATLYTIATATLAVGDQLLYVHGSGWAALNSAGALKNVASGLVAADVPFTPTGGIAATNVQTAIAEVDTEKAPLASPTFTGTVTIPTPFTLGAVSVTPTGTELNFVDGVTSAIQTQIDGKATLTGPTFTGTVTASGDFVVGDAGTEALGINLNGTTQTAIAKISDAVTGNTPQLILDKHSSTIGPRIYTGRSKNATMSTHASVGSADELFGLFVFGATGTTEYDAFGALKFLVGTGAVSGTSSPGKFVVELTPNGSTNRDSVLTIDSDKTARFAGDILPTDGTTGIGRAANKLKHIHADYTNTATVGAVTINKMSGRVNIAAAGTAVTVTNSLVTAASHVFAVASTNDATAQVKSVVPAAGSFVINTAACTAQTSFDFFVLNAD